MRIKNVDGLRGVAILAVLLFHAYFRWSDTTPWTENGTMSIVGEYGWLGVQLFFTISGFVIFMSLERCTVGVDFLRKRWLRLFPAMLLASVLIFATAPLLSNRPAGDVSSIDIVPGLLFVEPAWLTKALGTSVFSLDGAFWSIYAEVKFYLVASLSFFVFKDTKGHTIGLAFLVYCFLFALNEWVTTAASVSLAYKACIHLSLPHFGWFAVGVFYWHYYRDSDRKFLLLSASFFAISAIQLAISLSDLTLLPVSAAIYALWVGSFKLPWIDGVLSGRFFQLFGFVSYPLYLIHQNIMVALSIDAYDFAPWLPAVLVPLVPIGIVVSAAYVVAKYGEPYLRGWIVAGAGYIRKRTIPPVTDPST